MNSWTKSLIGFLMGLLGFQSCDPFALFSKMYAPEPAPYEEPVDEYGCPYATFKFEGEATDPDGNPIPGVRVVVAPGGLENGDHWYNDTLYTDAQGKAAKELSKLDLWIDRSAMEVKFTDVDGDENGAFQEKVLSGEDIQTVQTEEGDDRWYDGAYLITAKATLEPKPEE